MNPCLPALYIRRSLPALLVLIGALIFGLAVAAKAQAQWSRESLAIDGSQFSVDHELRLLPDGTAVMFASTDGSNAPLRLLRRPVGGKATVAPAFPTSIASKSSSDDLRFSQPDAAGNLLIYRAKSGDHGSALLGPTASPGTLSLAPHNQITALSMSQSGAAAAIMSTGSDAHVSFRPAGTASTFDALRPLDKMGNQRSYSAGITLDPDGGVFVVYQTQQGSGLFQTYAPPGGDFGPASLLPVPEESIESGGMEKQYAQSTNGHVIFTWSEYQQSGANWKVRAYAMIRKPGGLLGPKKLIASAVEGSGKTASVTSQGITDDGTAFAAILESDMNTRCPVTNIDGDSGMALAILAPGGASWTRIQGQKTWPKRTDFGPIVTAGNMVAVGRLDTTDSGPRCESGLGTTSSVSVHRGKGASVGSAELLNSQDTVNQNIVRIQGLAVNAVGQVSAMTRAPSSPSFAWFLHSHDARYDADPDMPSQILKSPGRIKISGKTLVATRYRVALPTVCVTAGPGDKVACVVNANITSAHEALARVKGAISTASASAKKAAKKKGKRGKKVKRQVSLGKVKARVAPGKTKRIVIKLNAKAKKALKRVKVIPVTLKVTITKRGANKRVITRKMKLRAAVPKKKARGKSKGRGKASASAIAAASAANPQPTITLVKAKARPVVPIDVNRYAYTDRIELACRGKATPLMAGWSSPDGSAGSVSVNTYSDRTSFNLMMVAPARAGKFKSWVTCLNRNLKTKYRYGKPAGERVSRVSCAKNQVALGLPVRNAPYYDKNVYSRPIGTNSWETNEGKYATAQVLCVARRAMKSVKLIEKVARFKPGSRTVKVSANCKGGRSPISWGFESDTMPDNTWHGGTNPVAAPLISTANRQGKRGWSLTFFTPDGNSAVKPSRVALHLTCAKPR